MPPQFWEIWHILKLMIVPEEKSILVYINVFWYNTLFSIKRHNDEVQVVLKVCANSVVLLKNVEGQYKIDALNFI